MGKQIKQYFKGYYFKCSTANETICLIPAQHSDGKCQTASIQIITENASYTVDYNQNSFDNKKFRIKIGENLFSSKGIKLNIKTNNLTIKGCVYFGDFKTIKYNIMGPFQYIPFMQCKHTVASMSHTINGKIVVNDKEYCFCNDIGYIEGDRGYSFPKEYIWTHCHFPNGSLMLSVADIPMMGFRFTGIIGVVIIDGKEYRIATYLGANVNYIKNNTVKVTQGKYTLIAKLLKANKLPLKAPNNGKMSRTIKESAACTARYKFIANGKTLAEFTSNMASFEYEYD